MKRGRPRDVSVRAVTPPRTPAVLLVASILASGAASYAQPRRSRGPRRPPVAVVTPVPTPTPPLTLDALLRRFAAMPGLSARFREEKRVALLAAPLVSEGTIHFAPPGRLARHTTSPSPTTVLIDGAQLRFFDGRQTTAIDMNATPVVRQFVDSFLALVAGDGAALARGYAMELQVDAAHPEAWTLTLRPRTPAVQRVFRDIVLRGTGVTLASMVMRETSGDETTTTFREVDAGRRYSAEEAARVFRIGG